jgi:hypothetical protein
VNSAWWTRRRANVGSAREKARAFLGLCALAEGRKADGERWLSAVDPSALDEGLRRAVKVARGEEP